MFQFVTLGSGVVKGTLHTKKYRLFVNLIDVLALAEDLHPWTSWLGVRTHVLLGWGPWTP